MTLYEESKLSADQKGFLERLDLGLNIFLTGRAGTGKSFIVKHAMDILKKRKKKFVAIAPTGVAANNIEGQTIHSLFGIPPYGVMSFSECNLLRGEKRRLLKAIDVIFIDEVSMLRPDILDAMQWTLKKNGCPGLETKQVIFIGDMKQLPPVLDDNTRSVLYHTYDGDEYFHADIFKKLNVMTVELQEVLRQSDLEFIEHLNIIREGGKHEYFKQFVHPDPSSEGIILAPYNATVQRYNEIGLQAQEGELLEFDATVTGNVKAEDFNLETKLRVKSGCKVMYLVNSQRNDLVNGTLGTFIAKDGKYFFRFNKTDFALNKVELCKKEYVYDRGKDVLELQEIGTITQYPIKLAYALSIHKAQGLSFDHVTIDLTRPCFQKGQLYVALSRVRTPQGLRILANR